MYRRNWRYHALIFTAVALCSSVAVFPAGAADTDAQSDTLAALASDTREFDDPTNVRLDEPATSLPRVALAVDTQVASRYLFQGYDYSEGKPVVQPAATLSFGGVSAAFWGNYDMHESWLNEMDLSLQYAAEQGPVSWSLGYVHLRYPHRVDWAPSNEVATSLALAVPLAPSVNVHYDFTAGTGTYATFGLTQELPRGFAVNANLFHMSHYFDATGVPAVELHGGWSGELMALRLSAGLSRFVGVENGTFTGANRLKDQWLVSFGIGRDF